MFTDFSGWWESLPMLEQVFWIIALSFTAIFVYQLMRTLVQAEPLPLPPGVRPFAGSRFRLITVRTLVGGVTIFAWISIACFESGLSAITTVLVASLCALLMIFIMAAVYYLMAGLGQEEEEIRLPTTREGEVIQAIPALRRGIGRILITDEGSLQELEAITDDEAELLPGTVVMITDIIQGSLLIVTKNTKLRAV